MERRIAELETALEGSVDSLIELLEEDPQILDRTIISCISETPLHIESMLGHVDFVEILNRKPELATELDSQGCSPLHLASSAKNHLRVVRDLLSVDPEMCMVCNIDGRTALHVAAIKGRVEALSELVRVRPESTRVLTDRGETALHLCVRYNRLEALKLLIESMNKDIIALVNWKDSVTAETKKEQFYQ